MIYQTEQIKEEITMIDAKTSLLDRFNQEYWIFLVLLVLSGITLISVFALCLIKYNNVSRRIKIAFVFCILLFLCITIMVGHIFSKYHSDKEHLKNFDVITITGEVIDFAVSTSGDELTTTKSWPIIRINGSNEQISLRIINSETILEINRQYTFIYLPNTKIAEIVR